MANQIKGLLQMLRSGGAPKGVAALHSVDDIRPYAKKRLPKMIYDFVYGGANDETTLAANRNDFSKITFHPRMLTDVTHRDIGTKVAGIDLDFPVMVSPAGLLRVAHTEGELAVARAAGKTGVVFVVSTAASWSMVDIVDAVGNRTDIILDG